MANPPPEDGLAWLTDAVLGDEVIDAVLGELARTGAVLSNAEWQAIEAEVVAVRMLYGPPATEAEIHERIAMILARVKARP